MGVRVRIASSQDTLLGALADGIEPVTAWRAYRAMHADVLDSYEATFGPPDRSEAELAGAIVERLAVLRERERALDLRSVAPRVAELFAIPAEFALEAVTFVGWDRALAWCDDEAAHPRAYFALERMPDDPGLCRALGAHELAHLAHFRLRPGVWPAWSVWVGLFCEAIAASASRALVPGLDIAEQLALQPGALPAYAERRAEIHAELLELLKVVDEATFRRVLFPPALCDGDVAGVGETGYAAALELGEAWVARGVTLAQAARMTPAQAQAELVELLSR